jgi:tetratricopeptide (TPR) repeat protein
MNNYSSLEESKYEEKDTLTLERLEEAEATDRNFDDWFILGVNAYLQEDYEYAILYFDKMLEKNPESAKGYVYRADVHADSGNYGEALNDYRLACHFGDHRAQVLLDEFVAYLGQRNLLNEKGELKVAKDI